jgi:hypothetical protein
MIFRSALAAAVALVVIGAAVLSGVGRGWLQRPAEPLIAAVLDLRPLSPTRGEEPAIAGAVLTLRRGRLGITIQLPVGSEDGAYDVAVMVSGRVLQSGQGTARAQDSVMVLTVRMDLRSLGPGRYAFGVRRVGSGWQEYPLRLE